MMGLSKRWKLWRATRGVSDTPRDDLGGVSEHQIIRENIEAGIDPDFRLPYPVPRNEHEEGMNMVAVMAAAGKPVMSARADW